MLSKRVDPPGLMTGLFFCALAAVSAATLTLSGCGGSSKPASVAVTATATTVDATDTVTLTATVTNDKNSAGVTWTVSGGGTLSGTTTTSATFTAPAATSAVQTATVTATSKADASKSGSVTITVPAALAVTTTAAQLTGSVGTAFSVQLTTSAGISPYVWTLATGSSLPTGWTLSAGGLLAGPAPVAGQAGTIDFSVDVADSGTPTPMTATAALVVTINAAPAITITGTVPTTATYNVAYAGGSAAATGGAGALTYSVSVGSLPTGLTLNASTGAITGTPTVVGAFPFTIQAADAFGDSASQKYMIGVTYPALAVTAATLPTGYVGTAYTQTTLAATGGSGKGYSFALASGSNLPAGIALSTTGVISGKPTGTPGTANFTVTVTDSASNTANGSFSITVDAGVSITTGTTLPVGYVGSSYSQTLAATGGSGTGYNWAVTSGSTAPGGLTLSAGGVLSGKPTTVGTPSFSITVTDSVGNTASATFGMTISAGVSIGAITMPIGYPGTAYTAPTPTATGGSGTGYVWSWAAASGSTLPAGLSISATTGVISGTPTNSTTASVVSSVVVTATDSVENTGSITLSVTIEATLAISTGATLPGGVVTTAYTDTLAATGGSGGNTWSTNTAGTTSLSAIGLSLSSAGVVSGTTPTLGTATFAATVKDSANHTASVTFSVTISNALTVTTNSLPAKDAGTPYSQQLAAAGGTGTGYAWSVSGTSNLATFNLTLSTGGLLSGTPATSGTATFTAKVTDSASNTATEAYTIQIYPQLALPSSNPGTLGPATTSQPYTGTIVATGGSGSGYVWVVSETLQGLTAGGSGTTLTINGTAPATAQTITFTATVTDSTGASVGPNTYTIAVNPPGAQVSGQINLNNICGNVSLPAITVSINTTPVQTTTTNSSGNYTFAGIPAGTYTITPSITGTGVVSLFSPQTQSVTLSGSDVTKNFSVSLGYTVSGTVAYTTGGTAQAGQTYLILNNNNCGGGGGLGTSISNAILTSTGDFTIRGVPPGTYTLDAWMDPFGQGIQNALDPTTGVNPTLVTVTNASPSGVVVTLTNPAFATPAENPKINGIIPNAEGVLIEFSPSKNSNGVEDANQYLVQWSTSATLGGGTGGGQFGTIAGSHTFTASGDKGVWILNNAVLAGSGFSFSSGTTYYFQARSFDTLDTANPHPSGWCNYTSSGCTGTTGFTPVTIGTPTCTGTCTAVSSSVTIPASITIATSAPLYLGLVQLDSNGNPTGIYVTETLTPVIGANDFTVTVPSGSNYAVIGILDQTHSGGIGFGAITNVQNNLTGNLTISGSTQTVPGITLPTANSTAAVTTQYKQSTDASGSSTSYQLNFEVRGGNKLPVAVTLTSGPNVLEPADISNSCGGCGNPQFQYSSAIVGATPTVGDTYDFTVTYSDGTQDTGTTVNGAVTGWNGTSTLVGASDLATGLSPTGNTDPGGTTPTFTWTYPANASNYIYSFSLCCDNNATIWQIPGNNSQSNGFTSVQVPVPAGIAWGTDPTGGGSTPTGSLTSGTTYDWQIQVQDSTGNSAQAQVSFIP